MTIQELEALNGNFDAICQNTCDNYMNMLPKTPYTYIEQDLNFWSSILDCISDQSVKEAVFFIISEFIFYHRTIGTLGADEIEEIANAYEDDRCFIFPFKPGDYIADGKYETPKRVVSLELCEAFSYPVVNVEEDILVEAVRTEKSTIDYPDIAKYKVVDEPEMHVYISKTGEDFDTYWI